MQLDQAYTEYVTHYSRADEAISYEASCYLWSLLERRAPARILDLGSGWSSFVFRTYQRQHPEVRVCSVDDSESWIGVTARFLARHRLDTSHLHLWPWFEAEPYDLVFYDMGRPWDRAAHLPRVFAATAGLLVLDDMHKEGYHAQVAAFAAECGVPLRLVRDETLDGFGRFMGTIDRGDTSAASFAGAETRRPSKR